MNEEPKLLQTLSQTLTHFTSYLSQLKQQKKQILEKKNKSDQQFHQVKHYRTGLDRQIEVEKCKKLKMELLKEVIDRRLKSENHSKSCKMDELKKLGKIAATVDNEIEVLFHDILLLPLLFLFLVKLLGIFPVLANHSSSLLLYPLNESTKKQRPNRYKANK